MRTRLSNACAARRGATLVLAALLMMVMLGMVAFAVDCGYMSLVRGQLQVAADSAAMAAAEVMGTSNSDPVQTAKTFAGYHAAGGRNVSLQNSDVEYGVWNPNTQTFAPSQGVGNALRISAKIDAAHGGQAPLFFGRAFGLSGFDGQAQAIAMGRPRDICFVVDLSGSMNNDTEPGWAPAAMGQLNSSYGPIANGMMQQVFTDFNYGSYPGTTQWVGQPLGVTQNNNAYTNLTATGGPLTQATIASTYKIASGDSEATRKTKAYKWIIDNQIASIMPNARPTPNSGTSYNYWAVYLDYILPSVSASGRGTLPPSQGSNRIDGLDNPSTASYPNATASLPQSFRNKIGYVTYVQFMMDFGRDQRPDGSTYTPLSIQSSFCPYHSENTAGGVFSFPPSEQPTHAARRSIIAAIQQVKSKNAIVSDSNNGDWVSIVAFDAVAGTVLKQSLTSNYDAAMQTCTQLQAVGDTQLSTATETGLAAARNHIKPVSQGGAGREKTQKVIVLLTDGMANLKSSSNSTVSTYRTAHPSSNFYGGTSSTDYASDAALMQTAGMQGDNWNVYAVALGLGADYGFMDRMARQGNTADDDGQAPRTSGDPSAYEAELTSIFKDIIATPKVTLVQ
jgi:hypothetical protein